MSGKTNIANKQTHALAGIHVMRGMILTGISILVADVCYGFAEPIDLPMPVSTNGLSIYRFGDTAKSVLGKRFSPSLVPGPHGEEFVMKDIKDPRFGFDALHLGFTMESQRLCNIGLCRNFDYGAGDSDMLGMVSNVCLWVKSSFGDAVGLVVYKTHDLDEVPPGGWPDSRDLGMTIATFRNPIVVTLRYKNGKVGFKVTFNPRETRIDIYFKRSAKIITFKQEREHVDCYLPYDTALEVFKDEVEGIYACSKTATDLYDKAVKKLELAEKKCRKCNEELDKPGGKHGH